MSAYLPAKRPFAVTLTLWGVFFFGVWNVSKVVLLVQNRPLLLARGVNLDPLWQAVGAVVWAGLFLMAAWALWRKRPSTLITIPLLLLVYGAYTVGIRLIFSPLPFLTSGGLLIIIFFAAICVITFLALQRAKRKLYFAERRE